MADGPVLHVVPHDVDDVGALSVLLAQLGELRVYLLVLRRPLVPVLRKQHLVLGVVDDLAGTDWSRTSEHRNDRCDLGQFRHGIPSVWGR